MRELRDSLKFRAWIEDDKRYIHDCSPFLISNSEVVIEQYTGLKDKNGEEVYEGDIVANGTLTGVVEYKVDDFCAWTVGTTTNGTVLLSGSWTVIGNIHEGSKLFKEEKWR